MGTDDTCPQGSLSLLHHKVEVAVSIYMTLSCIHRSDVQERRLIFIFTWYRLKRYKRNMKLFFFVCVVLFSNIRCPFHLVSTYVPSPLELIEVVLNRGLQAWSGPWKPAHVCGKFHRGEEDNNGDGCAPVNAKRIMLVRIRWIYSFSILFAVFFFFLSFLFHFLFFWNLLSPLADYSLRYSSGRRLFARYCSLHVDI